MEELSYEFLGVLVKDGYLTAVPLHDSSDTGSWSVYVTSQSGIGMACKIHGDWNGKGFEPSAAQAAAPAPARVPGENDPAFAKERAAAESKFEPLERMQLGGPISASVLGLSESATEVTLDELFELAKSPSSRTRSVVALALRRLRNPKGVHVLRTLLTDTDEYVRKQAAWALGQIGTPNDTPYLVPLLDDPAERVRDFAAFALARLGNETGVERSIASLKDAARNPIRRGEAAVALADGPLRLSSGRYGMERRAWEAAAVGADRYKELAARVRAVVQEVLASGPPPDLAQRCTYALGRLKLVS